MEKIHPASINPKMNKNRYLDKIRKTYASKKEECKMRGGNDEKIEEIISNSNNNNSNSNSNSNIEKVEEAINGNNNNTNYKYVGALATMAGQVGVILYWFMIS
jgi:hypothetical protein